MHYLTWNCLFYPLLLSSSVTCFLGLYVVYNVCYVCIYILLTCFHCLQVCDVERGLDNQEGSGCKKSNSSEKNSRSSGERELNHKCHSLLEVLKLVVVVILIVTVLFTVWYFLGWMVLIELLVIAVVAFLAAGGGYRWLKIFIKTIPRDLT